MSPSIAANSLGSLRWVTTWARSSASMPAPKSIQQLPEYRYLRARLEEREQSSCEAARALDIPWRFVPPMVRDDLRRRWARATARCGGCQDALSVLMAEESRDGSLSPTDDALVAECEVTLEAYDLAETRLRRLLKEKSSSLDVVALSMTLAEVLRKTNRSSEALALLRDVWIHHPEHPQSEQVVRMIVAVEGSASLSFDESVAQIETLNKSRHYREAIARVEAIEENANPV
ncbi:MAG: hypothetical protein R3A47_07810 [Polyangiales bacterium]